MFNLDVFIKCVRSNLKSKGYGDKKAKDIVGRIEGHAKYHIRNGLSDVDAYTLGLDEVTKALDNEVKQKAKRARKMLERHFEHSQRLSQGDSVNISLFDVKGKPNSSRGEAIAKAAVSLLEHDVRFSGQSYNTHFTNYFGAIWAHMNDVANKAGKGTFGLQRGKAHLENIVKEIFGEDTGDVAAKQLSEAWLKGSDFGVDLFNMVGGSLNKIKGYIPSPDSSVAKLAGASLRGIKGTKQALRELKKTAAYKKYEEIALRTWDWNRMRHPDGSPIYASEYKDVIKAVYDVKVTDGAVKIDPSKFRGNGVALGDKISQNRFVHYKNADGWLEMHNAFGDGSVFDVLSRHVRKMAHDTAMVRTFGPNPELAKENIKSMVRKYASKYGHVEVANAETILKNTFDPMFDVYSHHNPMNPDALMPNIVGGLTNIIHSAFLGSSSLLALTGDMTTTVLSRAATGLNLFGGMSYYIKALATDREFMRELSTQSGFIMDEYISGIVGITRYSSMATYGPLITKRLSDTVMRASLLSGHTVALRNANKLEFAGLLFRYKDKAFDDLPFQKLLTSHGITATDWNDFVTNVLPHSPKKGLNFLRPIDVFDSKLPAKNNLALYEKFQGMINEQARNAVPEAMVSSAVVLKGSSRPDSLRGLLLHSFATLKNFPVTYFMLFSRLGMLSPSVKGRMSFYAGTAAAMTFAGALAVQMKELSQGRDPARMDTPEFYGKAALAGGGMGILGDFLFSGINQYGQGLEDVTAGPLVGFGSDLRALTFSDMADYVKAVRKGESFEFKLPEKMVQFAKRYTPGTNIWWLRAPLERQLWDRLEELADPDIYNKRMRKVINQQEMYGNEYWWPPGSRTPERAPRFSEEQ